MIKISLALGGGGIRGIAHIGVLRRLEEEGVRIMAISGTSAGSIVGAFYASGFSPDEIEEIVLSVNQARLFGRNTENRPALLGMHGLTEILEGVLRDNTFNSLKIPFACTAVDINSGLEVVLKEGKLLDAVLASSAVPGIFPPVSRDEMLLVDGGVLDPVPITTAKSLMPGIPVVAVCLSKEVTDNPADLSFTLPIESPITHALYERITRLRIAQAFNIFLRSMDISSRLLTELQLQADPPDVIIRPDVDQYSMLDNVDPQTLIQIGYQAADASIPQIRNLGNLVERLELKSSKIWSLFKKPF